MPIKTLFSPNIYELRLKIQSATHKQDKETLMHMLAEAAYEEYDPTDTALFEETHSFYTDYAEAAERARLASLRLSRVIVECVDAIVQETSRIPQDEEAEPETEVVFEPDFGGEDDEDTPDSGGGGSLH